MFVDWQTTDFSSSNLYHSTIECSQVDHRVACCDSRISEEIMAAAFD